jgi:hypothetical protein
MNKDALTQSVRREWDINPPLEALKWVVPVHWMESRQLTTAMWKVECRWKDGTTSLILMRNLEALTLLSWLKMQCLLVKRMNMHSAGDGCKVVSSEVIVSSTWYVPVTSAVLAKVWCIKMSVERGPAPGGVISMEMKHVPAADGFCKDNVMLKGYEPIACQIVLVVMIDFTRMAIFLAGGHLMDLP